MCGLPEKIAVLGLGRSGLSVIEYLLRHRADSELRIAAYDSGDSRKLREYAALLRERSVEVFLGATCFNEPVDLVVTSPGIPPHAPLFTSAASLSERMISELEFAFEHSISPWLAVTGTNGKTTVTALLAHLLREAGRPVECVGNIGRPAIDIVDDGLPETAIVAEVSSFQLALTQEFRPSIAVLLNISEDHLDWHGSLENYIADKVKIFQNMSQGDVAVIDVDDPRLSVIADTLEPRGVRILRVSRKTLQPGGAGMLDDILVIDGPFGPIELVSSAELLIPGAHNISNALAAAAAAFAWGIDPEAIRRGLKSFTPVAHRLQRVDTIDGVEYINDSKATNPASTIVALAAFPERGIVLLMGGRNKGSEFSGAAIAARDFSAKVVAFGEAAPEIFSAMRVCGVECVSEGALGHAIEAARELARPGDVVLLSPGCASFDEFDGFEHRGRYFADKVGRFVDESAG